MTARQIQKEFERRQARYEARYRKQFYQYLNSVNRAIASDMVANDTMQVTPSQYLNTDRLQGILVRMYKTVTLNEAKEEYRLENDRGQKDIIDDIINILRPEGSESQLVRVWRNLLNEWVTGRVLDQITEIDETTVNRIKKLIEEGLLSGQGPRETARQIRDDTKYTLNRSLAIARTESVRAMNQGKFMAALTSPFEKEKKWLSANDARTRQSHKEIGNRDEWIPLTDDFTLKGEEGSETALYPGDNRLSAAEVINCYLPDTIITGNIKSAQQSFYSGDVFEIITARGKRLSVTPNHGILTDNGFIQAQNIKIGDNLICNTEKVSRFFPLSNNYVKKKFRAANIFRSFENLFRLKNFMVIALDFDGDGESMHGNVNVINSKSSLMYRRISSIFKRVDNFIFKKTGFKSRFLSRFCSFDLFGGRNNSSSARLMSFLVLSFPLCFRHVFPLSFFRLGLVSKLDTIRFKDSVDNTSRDALFLSELINTNSVSISFDEVVNIRKFYYSGHVYDFSSVNGVNIANNIYTSNCRCSLLTRNRRDANGALIRKKSQRPEEPRLYVTQLQAIDPNDGNLKTWSGPYVIGKSTQDAQEYCDTNNMGYVKVIGPLIQTIDYEA